MSRILLTGAGGRLARLLVPALTEAGHPVIGVDLCPVHLPPDRKSAVPLCADITDEATMGGLLETLRPDVLLHLAALVPDRKRRYTEDELDRVNHQAADRLFALAKHHQVPAVLHISTTDIYGDNPDRHINEKTPVNPRTAYGRSKWKAEQALLRQYSGQPDSPRYAIFRLAPVYSPDLPDPVYRRIYLLRRPPIAYRLRKGRSAPQFLSAALLVQAVLQYLSSPPGTIPDGVYLLADPEPTTLADYIAYEQYQRGLRIVLPLPVCPLRLLLRLMETVSHWAGNPEPYYSTRNLDLLLDPPHYDVRKGKQYLKLADHE